MDDTIKRLSEFRIELSHLLNDKEEHKYFRYRTLLLIKKYFDFQKMMFTLYEDDLEVSVWKFNLDTVTFGIETNMVNEYYNTFHKMDPTVKWPGNDKVVDLYTIVNEEDFLISKYYLEFFKKYDVHYEVNSLMTENNKKVGKITFLRSFSEGPYTAEEIYIITEINEIVLNELRKAMQFKKLHLELLVLKELSDTFPVGKVVLSDNHNISYFNEFGEEFIHGLTGSKNINFFKYFFLNEILIGRDGIKEKKPFSIEIDGFWLKIIPYDDIVSEKKEKIKYIVFIVKNTIYEEKKIKINFERILTTREKEVSNLIRMGYSNKEISIALNISIATVKAHIQKIYEKCGAKNRIHLINKLYIK